MKTKITRNIMLTVSILFSNQFFAQAQHVDQSPEVGVNNFMILLFAAGVFLGYYKLVYQNRTLKS